MIYSRFGAPVTIVAYCGKHQPHWSNSALVLVKIQYADDDGLDYTFAHSLRADKGPQEIDDAVDAAPVIELSKSELTKLLKTL